MNRKMLINALDSDELRVAVVEDGRLEAFFVETASREQTRGNIYKGRVVNVEPGLQAAFIDYGGARHGFLQVSDVNPVIVGREFDPDKPPPLQEILKPGQEFLIQVVKEETGGKGASLTTYFSIPGQYLVLTPGHDSRGVSRKLEDDKERKRLKEILESLKVPEDLGVIVRTAAEGRLKKELAKEFQDISRLWQDIAKRGEAARAPRMIHKEAELALRTVRDLFTADLAEILVDDSEVYERLKRYVTAVSPRRKGVVKHYREKRPIFSKYQLEEQLASIYQSQVRLPSGGGIVINPTEALVAIDVNSGKSHGGKQIEETAYKVNLEAAVEIARQLRLRDLGGLIVVDFIDMRDRSHQRQVRKALAEELKKDKAKTTVGHISRFGLLELSRQRIRPPIDFGSSMICPHCQGQGMVRTPEAVGRVALRQAETRLRQGAEGGGLCIRLAPAAAHYVANQRRGELGRLESHYAVCLEVRADGELGPAEMVLEACKAPWSLAVPLSPEEPPPFIPEEPEVEEEPEEEAPAVEESAARKTGKRRSRRKKKSGKPKASQTAGETAQAGRPSAPEGTEGEGSSGGEGGTEASEPSAEGGPPAAKKRRRRSSSRRRKKRPSAQSAEGGEPVPASELAG